MVYAGVYIYISLSLWRVLNLWQNFPKITSHLSPTGLLWWLRCCGWMSGLENFFASDILVHCWLFARGDCKMCGWKWGDLHKHSLVARNFWSAKRSHSNLRVHFRSIQIWANRSIRWRVENLFMLIGQVATRYTSTSSNLPLIWTSRSRPSFFSPHEDLFTKFSDLSARHGSLSEWPNVGELRSALRLVPHMSSCLLRLPLDPLWGWGVSSKSRTSWCGAATGDCGKFTWLFRVDRGWNASQVCGYYFINHEIRIPMKQPVFEGK